MMIPIAEWVARRATSTRRVVRSQPHPGTKLRPGVLRDRSQTYEMLPSYGHWSLTA